jgi:hypothetical protein
MGLPVAQAAILKQVGTNWAFVRRHCFMLCTFDVLRLFEILFVCVVEILFEYHVPPLCGLGIATTGITQSDKQELPLLVVLFFCFMILSLIIDCGAKYF